MRKTEKRQGEGMSKALATVILGALLALGIELMVLLLGSIAVSADILRMDTMPQLTAAACLIGCFLGGSMTCRQWAAHRFPAGLLTGFTCFLLILLTALFLDGAPLFGMQAALELAACIIGGGLAGVLAGRRSARNKKRR